jgi:NAD(P)-dependent dehydrogenase (short-subunit alcohol dehydrogenase family)
MSSVKTIAIVGAGPQLGFAIARRFGAEGLGVALLARSGDRLERLATALAEDGITARAYVADVTEREGLIEALHRVEADFGAIDVLEFSPVPPVAPVPAAAVTPESVIDIFEAQVLGAIAAVNAVLPGMRERGDGVLLFTTGASSVFPIAMMGNAGIAGAALRNYAHTLHQALASEGIYAAHVALDLFIQPGAGEADPDSIAGRFYELCQSRDRPELKIGNYIEQALEAAKEQGQA